MRLELDYNKLREIRRRERTEGPLPREWRTVLNTMGAGMTYGEIALLSHALRPLFDMQDERAETVEGEGSLKTYESGLNIQRNPLLENGVRIVAGASPAPVKRGRGRPRKNPLPVVTE